MGTPPFWRLFIQHILRLSNSRVFQLYVSRVSLVCEFSMPVYEYRCKTCAKPSTFLYKSVADYDAARASLLCKNCGSADLTRLISRIAIAKPGKNYAAMSSNEMLSVFEGGDSREVGRMIHEVGGDTALSDPQMADCGEAFDEGG